MEKSSMGTSFSLRYFLKIVFDYFWFIVVTLVALNGAVVIYNLSASKKYLASTRIYIERAAENAALIQKTRPFADPPSITQVLSTEGEILTSFPVVEAALQATLGTKPTAIEVSRMIENLQVIPLKNSNVLRVDFLGDTPQGTADMLNQLVGAYQSFRAGMHLPAAGSPVVDDRMRRLRFQIDSLYSAQEQLLTQYKIADFDNTMRFLNQSIFDTETTESIVKTHLSELRRQIAFYQGQAADVDKDPNHMMVVPEGWVTMVNLLRELEAAQTRLSTAQQTYLPAASQVREASAQLEFLKGQVAQTLKSHINDLRQQEQALLDQLAQHQTRVSQQRVELLSIPQVKSRSQSIEAALTGMNDLYAELERQQLSNDVTAEYGSEVTISLLAPATAPRTHEYPRRFQNILLGLLGSLLFTIALVYIYESLDTTIKHSDDFEKLGIPYLTGFTQSK